jgi:Protein of unknown function (DUF3742)
MTTQTSKGFAQRLGYGLGRVVAFVIPRKTQTLVARFVRGGLIGAAIVVVAMNYGWIVSSALTLMVLVGALYSLSKVSTSGSPKNTPEYGYDYGPQGYGYYQAGQRVDDDD